MSYSVLAFKEARGRALQDVLRPIRFKHNQKLTIVGDGDQRRDFTYIEDVVRANIMAAESKVYHGLFNIGTGRNYSINQVADLVGGDKTYIPSRSGEARETMADISKATQILGWSPNHRLEDTVLSY